MKPTPSWPGNLHRKSNTSTAGRWGIGKTIAAKHRPAECVTKKIMNRVHPNVNIVSQNIVAFQGKANPIFNFYPCEIKVFGEVHQSAEHANQFKKAI